jgi:hypothetical protein
MPSPIAERLFASDPKAIKWHIVLDNLNLHQSESQVALDC